MGKRCRWIVGGIVLIGALGLVGVSAVKGARSHPTPSFPVDGTLPIPPRPNAHDAYVDIANRLRIPKALQDRKSRLWKDYPDAARVIATNAEELARVDDALKQAYREPFSLEIVPLFPHHAKIKELGRLLILRGDMAFARRDFRAAADDFLRVVQIGSQIANGSYDAAFFAGDRLMFTGLRAIERTVEHLPAPERDSIGRRLEVMATAALPFSQAIAWEKIQSQIAWNRVLTKPTWAKAVKAELEIEQFFSTNVWKPDRIEEMKGRLGLESDKSSMLERLIIERTRPEALFYNTTAYYDAWIVRVNGKFSNRSSPMPSLVAPGHLPDIFTGWIQEAELRYTFDDPKWLSRLRTVTSVKLLGIRLRGDAALANASLMADPFDPGKSFRILRQSGRTLVSSVGPDGKDDRVRTVRDPISFTKIEDLEKYRGDLGFIGD